MTGKRIAALQFFKPLKPNPLFTFENGVEKIAEYELDADRDYPIGESSFKIYIKLNGTFIDIQGVHTKCWKKCKVKLKFD
jgi:hypothetical protein